MTIVLVFGLHKNLNRCRTLSTRLRCSPGSESRRRPDAGTEAAGRVSAVRHPAVLGLQCLSADCESERRTLIDDQLPDFVPEVSAEHVLGFLFSPSPDVYLTGFLFLIADN